MSLRQCRWHDGVNIRRARVADAWDVAKIHVASWQAAYRGIVPHDYLDGLSAAPREKFWRESVERGNPELWVAEVNSSVVGWVAFDASRDPDADGTIGEISAIYSLQAYWSTGVGRGLWQTARGRLIERGFTAVTLWVFADNARAIRFYRAAGFEPMPGSEQCHERGGKSLLEHRYICRLD
jgi:ribosomal protein S18 acetylase RimI-like enzyme